MCARHAERCGRALLVVLALIGCAGGPLAPVRPACTWTSAALGAVLGGTLASDTRAGGAAAGAAGGALVGALMCGEPPPELRPPTTGLLANPEAGEAPLEVKFDAVAEDTDGSIVHYAWDFGDGGSGRGARLRHAYTQPGEYVVTLTVTDSDGLTATTRRQIVVRPAENDPVRPE